MDNYSNTIGDQEWMTENLNVDKFRNGDPIFQAKTNEEWKKAAEYEKPAYCYMYNGSHNGKLFGKLYNWYAVNDSRGLAPKGWHIPNFAEWKELDAFLGGENLACIKMKSKAGWYNNANGTNESGFHALPGGFRDSSGSYSCLHYDGFWWSVTENTKKGAWSRGITNQSKNRDRFNCDKSLGLSVRCLKDRNISLNQECNVDRDCFSKSHEISARCLRNLCATDTVKVGNQEWMVKNLNVDRFQDGDLIPQAITAEEWIRASENQQPAWCYFDNIPANGEVLGKLYNWYAVNDPRGLSPKGWQIPGIVEWLKLTSFLGGEDEARNKIRSKSDWEYGTNESGLNALPSGFRDDNGFFFGIGTNSSWWLLNDCSLWDAWRRSIGKDLSYIQCENTNKSFGFSVRCLRDIGKNENVIIGNQEWMTKNLNVEAFRNGESIIHAKTTKEWESACSNRQPAYCYYGNDPKNEEMYGKLYNWVAVNDSRGLAPRGWHIPTNDDWVDLIEFLENNDITEYLKDENDPTIISHFKLYLPGLKLKSKNGWHIYDNSTDVVQKPIIVELFFDALLNNSGWYKYGNGNNQSGFNAFPGGYRSADGSFCNVGAQGKWWIAKDCHDTVAWYQLDGSSLGNLYWNDNHKFCGLSVRCLRDLSTYLTIKIGDQKWMVKNLNLDRFQNGDKIPHARTVEEWKIAAENAQPAWCYYNNDPANEADYGKLYNWYAVNDNRGLAPKGWHIPSNAEWSELTSFLGCDFEAGTKMLSRSGWFDKHYYNDDSDFNALPSGMRTIFGKFKFARSGCWWWSATPNNISRSWAYFIGSTGNDVNHSIFDMSYGFSVRCLQDSSITDKNKTDNSAHIVKSGYESNYNTKCNLDFVEREYKTFKIERREWMINNLDVEIFQNGDLIPHAKTLEEWERAGEKQKPAWCNYGNNPYNGNKYGKLYNWHAVNDKRGLAPRGWRIPSNEDWTELNNFILNFDCLPFLFKNKSDLKNYDNCIIGINFNNLLSGGRDFIAFHSMGYQGLWWSITEESREIAYCWLIKRGFGTMTDLITIEKYCGFSVRCIRE